MTAPVKSAKYRVRTGSIKTKQIAEVRQTVTAVELAEAKSRLSGGLKKKNKDVVEGSRNG